MQGAQNRAGRSVREEITNAPTPESQLCSADKGGFEVDLGGCALETPSILGMAAGSLL